tara:strand:- start:1128 stop:1751 length:624 start_codon:yes stop_codon:yes gene_type:complete
LTYSSSFCCVAKSENAARVFAAFFSASLLHRSTSVLPYASPLATPWPLGVPAIDASGVDSASVSAAAVASAAEAHVVANGARAAASEEEDEEEEEEEARVVVAANDRVFVFVFVVVVVVVFAGCRRRATTRGDASWRPSAAMVIVLRVRGRARASNTVSAVVSCAAAWRSREGVVAPASTRHRSETAPESSRRVVADRDRRKALQER